MATTLIIAAERPWNRKEKIHQNTSPKEAPQMLRRRLILVQADHGSWCMTGLLACSLGKIMS